MTKIESLGVQIIIDAWGCKNIDNETLVREFLEESVKSCKATLLSLHTHKFSPQGISGVAIISESHISVHTWPEYNYAAIDIFTCGKDVEPYNTLDVVRRIFDPENITLNELKRGVSVGVLC